MEEILKAALDETLAHGAIYAEIRFQSDVSESVLMKNGISEVTDYSQIRGISVRALVRNSLGFSATNLCTKRAACKAARKAITIAHAASRLTSPGVSMDNTEINQARFEVKPEIPSRDIDLTSKIELLSEGYKAARDSAEQKGVKLSGCVLRINLLETEKIIINSDGGEIHSSIPRIALSTFLSVSEARRGTTQRFLHLGETSGWEAEEKWNLPLLLSEETYTLAGTLLEARKSPSEKMDIVLGPEVVGLVCHESCGHPSEADRILGREAAQAGETYLKPDSAGRRIGSPLVSVVDDPTIPHSFGFYLYDEEGVKSRKRFLMRKGVIEEFLHNRETATIFEVKSNGSSRAAAYGYEPIIRMANTFLEPGDYSREELIEDVKKGVYIKNFMEWNIDDRRYHQRYVGLEAYKIKDGVLGERVRNPVLEITTEGFWSSVDAVGDDLQFQAAYCGKGDPMQGIPVWTGGPHIRLRGVRIGGTLL
ncbi:MAG: TldD/PmbA family protein [Candidatus Bathyarchaeota archaeon]|nr:MAG: TldD/PmbA family protein [Candidatus Bathyarchaeota archaeon]